MDPMAEKYKTWFEEMEFGDLSKRAPLQCMLTRSLWDPEVGDLQINQVLDASVLQLNPNKSESFTDISENVNPIDSSSDMDTDSFIDTFFDLLPSTQNDGFAYPKISFREALDEIYEFSLLDDIDIDNKNLKVEQSTVVNKMPKTSAAAAATSLASATWAASRKSKVAGLDVSVISDTSDATSRVLVDAHDALKSRFKSAKRQFKEEGGELEAINKKSQNQPHNRSNHAEAGSAANTKELPEALKDYDKALVQKIESDILNHGQSITFEDISGLDFAKKCVQELICWPMLRPDIFTGLRALPKGLLLFGPPGTGKTLIGKAIAHQTGATFFSISSSSLTSKWIGEGEASVKTLFAVANYHQPSVVFIDEVDSLLCQRSSEENEATRRIKTEFLVQLDGAGTKTASQVVIIGATNRPQELDEAARRRFVKRLYIPLPDVASRLHMLKTLLYNNRNSLTEQDLNIIASRTEGFSGADMSALSTEAAMYPLREAAFSRSGGLQFLRESEVPPISLNHFMEALREVSASVSQSELQRYVEWNVQYGTYRRME